MPPSPPIRNPQTAAQLLAKLEDLEVDLARRLRRAKRDAEATNAHLSKIEETLGKLSRKIRATAVQFEKERENVPTPAPKVANRYLLAHLRLGGLKEILSLC